MHRRAAGLVAAAALLALACPAAARAAVPTVAFFGFDLVNTSLLPTTPAETARIGMLDDMLRRRLDASGRFQIAPIPPALRQRVAAGPAISGCNGCERDYAKAAGADWAAWGVVQKVSNLILNINLYMENSATGKMEFVKSVDIRGNNDESWRRGLDHLLHHYLFHEP